MNCALVFCAVSSTVLACEGYTLQSQDLSFWCFWAWIYKCGCMKWSQEDPHGGNALYLSFVWKGFEYQHLFSFTVLPTIWAYVLILLQPVTHFCIKLQLEMHVFVHRGEEPFVSQFWVSVPSHHFLNKLQVFSIKDTDFWMCGVWEQLLNYRSKNDISIINCWYVILSHLRTTRSITLLIFSVIVDCINNFEDYWQIKIAVFWVMTRHHSLVSGFQHFEGCSWECVDVVSALKMVAAGSFKVLKPSGKHITGMKLRI